MWYRIKPRKNLVFEARSATPGVVSSPQCRCDTAWIQTNRGVDGERGATLPEYAIILGVFVVIAVAMALAFKPLQESFHNDVTPGLDLSYPSNYVAPPANPPPAVPDP
jgi:Flp pilus assembly pilin Flp